MRASLPLHGRVSLSHFIVFINILLFSTGFLANAQCPPVITANPPSASVCMGDSITLSCQPSTGTTWQWYQDGSPITGATSDIFYAKTDGTYTVMVGGCPTASNSIPVVMKPLPIINLSVNMGDTVCTGQQVTLTVTSGPNVQWVWLQPPVLLGQTTNPYSTTLSATTTYQVVGVDQNTTCANTAMQTLIVVPQIVAGIISPSDTVCIGGTPSLITGTPATGSTNGFTYQWQISTTGPGGGYSDIPGATGLNYQPGPISVNTWFRRVATAPPCPDMNSNYVMIRVSPTPVITSPLTRTICSGTSVNYNPVSNVAGSTFTWTAVVTSGTVNGLVASGTGSINTVLSLPAGSTTSATVTYTITPTGPATTFCPGVPSDLVVTIDPTPIVTNVPMSQDICAGAVTTPVVWQSNVTGATFSWTASAPAGISGYQASGTGDLPAMQVFSTLMAMGTLTYTVIPTGPAPSSCPGTPATYTINIYPSPTITNTPLSQTICSGGTTTAVTLTSNVIGTTFSWTASAVPAGVTGYQVSGTNTIPSQTINNTSNIQGIVTYVITPSGSINGCAGIPRNYSVYVDPIPVATATPSTQIICSGMTTGINLSSTVSNTTFSWTASAPSSILGYSNGTGPAIIQTLTNTSNAPHDVTYVVTPTANGCVGNSITVVVTVVPSPNLVLPPPNQTTCSGVPVVLNLVANYLGVTFTWTASATGNVTGYSNGSGPTISQTLVNNDNVPRNVVYAVMMTLNGCTDGPAYITVTVNPTPHVTNAPLAATRCSGTGFVLSLTSDVAGTTYTYTANGSPGTSGYANGSGNTINQTLFNSGNSSGTVTYTITPTANGCAGPSVNYVVTVNPIPNVTPSLANQSICSGTSTLPVILSSSVSGTTYTWTGTPSAGGISGYTASGSGNIPSQTINSTLNIQGNVTYTIVPSSNSCMGASQTHVITVNPLPLVTNASMSQVMCSGGTSSNVNLVSNVGGTTFSWIATPSSPSITGYQPSGTNTIPQQTILNSSTTPGTVTYTITPTSNFTPTCNGTTANYVITVNPVPTITSSLSEAVCSGQPFTYPITSNLGGTSYTWSRAAVTGISNPASSGTSSTISESLINTTTSDINVTYVIQPYGQAPTLCPGTAQNLVVTVRALPQVNAGADLTIPYGTNTVITGSASGGAGSLSYSWTPITYIGSGANTPTPQTINLISNRTYTLAVTDGSGCTNSDAMTVFVVGSPISASPTATPSSICIGDNTALAANASGGSGTYTYSWSSSPAGFSSTSATAVVAPTVNTVYTVVVNDGYNTATSSVAVTVNPLPVEYSLTGGGEYCIGGPGVTVGLSGSQPGVSYQLFNNLNPVGTPVTGTGSPISFGNQSLAGNYTVEATRASTGCSNTMGSTVSVIINPLPVANAGIDQTIPYGTNTTLNGSVSGGFGPMSYSWTPVTYIGTGSTTPTPQTTNLYSNTTFTLRITDSKGCIGNDQMTVMLSGSAIAVNAIATPDEICADTSQSQLNAITTGGSGLYSYTWTSNPAGSPAWSSMLQSPMVSPDVTTTYTVVANDGFNTATASVTVLVHPLPLVYAVTGGGSYCYAGAGAPIGLSGSEPGVNYQLLRGGIPDGPPVTGTGSPISFGNRTAAFTYTVLAVNNTNGCSNMMSGSTSITILPPPDTYLVTGGGSYPLGGVGVPVGLTYGDAGVSYQLYCDNVPVGTPVAGANTSIDFGLQTQAGTYTVVATDILTGCTANMDGSVAIVILPLPNVYSVFGGGTICTGGPGLPVSMTGSENGIEYQLFRDGFPYGPIVLGTGLPINWGPFTVAGLFEVRAVNPSNGGSQMMNGQATIIVNPLPTIFTINPTGSQCPGTIIRLNGSDAGVNYYLLLNGIALDSIAGTGVVGFLDFGPQTANGTYTIIAVDATTGCQATMNGYTYINIAPQVFHVIPAGILCPGQPIGLDGSETGVSYQLRWNGTFDLGSPVPGTGSPITVGVGGLPGIYSIIAIDDSTNCVSFMQDSATLYPDPVAFTIVPDGEACEGDEIHLNGSETGVDYVLLLDGAIHLDTISGTGSTLNFGSQMTEGNYTIIAISQTSYCIYPMNGTAVFHDSPIQYDVIPAGVLCMGNSIGLTGSQPGISYQLILNGTLLVGSPVAGTGAPINFGPQNAIGTYTVRGINDTTNCYSTMNGSAVLEPFPVPYTVTPPGNHCPGTSIGINGSDLNHSYILVFNGVVHLDTIAGTGSDMQFGPQYTAGTYTVLAYENSTFCQTVMDGMVVIDPVPTAFNMIPAGYVCVGSPIGLDNSETGVSYQLRLDGTTNVGTAVTGTGAAISFGSQTVPGNYTVIATSANNCTSTMNGIVELHTYPVEFTVTPSRPSCPNTSVGINGSEPGVNYILVLDGSTNLDTIAGTGTSIDFGPQPLSGTYTVLAYHTFASCQSWMNGFAVIQPAPLVHDMTPTGVTCLGSSLGLEDSEAGVSYQLRLNNVTNVGGPVAGTGSAISYGSPLLPGIYTVVATAANGCTAVMNGSVTLEPLPVPFTITPSGQNCAGTSIGLNGSESGINYILILDGTLFIDTIAGNGGVLDFGPQITTGTYTILGYNATTNCQQTMTGISVINSVPTAFNLTPAGITCIGAIIGLDNTETGVTYQLRKDGSTNVGSPVAGTGSAIIFGAPLLPGTYTVVATASNGCTEVMNGTVTLEPLPVAFTMTINGPACVGASIGLNGSEIGINYVLILDGTLYLDTIPGNGGVIDFGPQSTTGTYTILGYNAVTDCELMMNGNVVITDGPMAFNLTPAGIACAGSVLGLDNSEAGVTYQLLRDGIFNAGSPVTGTGSSISFGVQALAGIYTVEASNGSGCIAVMNGAVMLEPLPTPYTIAPTGNQCPGTAITLNGSETGVNYILMRDGLFPVDTLTGTGSMLSFSPQLLSGTYTINAYSVTGSCYSAMNGSTVILTGPVAYNVTPAGVNCVGVTIGLDNSETGVDYQLVRNGSVPVGIPVAGTGSSISFGVVTIPGIYTVTATNSLNKCTIIMNGQADVEPSPLTFNLVPQGMQCAGVSITLNGSEAGIDYILVRDAFFHTDTLAGTGSALDFGPQTVAGMYTILAVGSSSSCQMTMDGQCTVMPLPFAFNVTPLVPICSSAVVGLDGSEAGIVYTLYLNGISTGISLTGTGSPISFGSQPAGNYTISATDPVSGCSSLMLGTATIHAIPAVSAGPDQSVCSDVVVSLNASGTNTGNLTWISSGNGIFSDATIFNPDYTFGSADLTAGSVQLILQASGTGACASMTASDTLIVAITLAPAVSAGPDLDVCQADDYTITTATAGNYSSLIWATSGTGNFINPTQLNATYIPSAADLAAGSVLLSLTVQGNAPCMNIVSDTLIMNFHAFMTMTAGPDAIICSTDSYTVTGATASSASSVIWNTLGSGSFTGSNTLTPTYYPSAPDIAAGSVALVLTTTGVAPCTTTLSDTMVINITTGPTVDAGADMDVCSGSVVSVMDANAGSYSSLLWTSSGNGSFSDTHILNTVYTPSAADIAAGSVTLTLTVNGFSPCAPVSDQKVITIHSAPSLWAGADTLICEGMTYTTFQATANDYTNPAWTTTGTGTFANVNTLSATYTPSAADIAAGQVTLTLTVDAVAPCAGSVSDSFVLTINKALTVDAGPDAGICDAVPFMLSSATASNFVTVTWTSSGSGSFTNSNVVNPVYVPGNADLTAGSVVLTLTGTALPGCSGASDSMILNLTQQPAVDAGADASICSGAYTLTGTSSSNVSSVVWTVANGTGLLVNASTLNPTYTPSAQDIINGFAILVLEGSPLSPCSAPASDSVVLSIYQVPVVNAGADDQNCEDNTYTVTDASASYYTSLNWVSSGSGTLANETTLTPSYTPSAADLTAGSVMLTLTASNPGCGSVSDSKTITFTSMPTVNAGPDLNICENTNITIGGATALNYASITWTTSGTGTFANGNTVSPTYTPSASDISSGVVTLALNATPIAPCGGTLTDQLILTISRIPLVSAGADDLVCEGSSYLINDAAASYADSIVWTTSGTGTFSNPLSLATTYSPSAADIANGSVTLTLTAFNSPCSDVTDSKVLTIVPAPQVNAGPGATVCNTCSFQVTGATASNASSVLWATSGTGVFSDPTQLLPVYQPSAFDFATGSVILQLTANGNSPCGAVADTMILHFATNPGIDFSWGSSCEVQPVQFTVDATATNIGSMASWYWIFGDGGSSTLMNPFHQYSAIGNYQVTLTAVDTLGNSFTNTHQIYISQMPVAYFGYNTPVCSNQSVQFTDLSHTLYGNIASWVWNYGDGTANDTILFPDDPNRTHQYDTSGVFNVTLTITNSFGCIADVTLPVDVIPAPVADFTYTNSCTGLNTQFHDASYANGSGNLVQWWWNFGDPATGFDNFSNLENPEHLFSAPGTYQVMHVVRNFNNCSDTIVEPVVILPALLVDFVQQHTCVNDLSSFAPDTSVMNVSAVASWVWDFGDGGYSYTQNAQHVFAAPGSYDVTLTVTDLNGCEASKTHTVVVNPLPVAQFVVSQQSCKGIPIAFDDVSTTYAGYIVRWEWDFGDGDTQTFNFPSNPDTEHTYTTSGTFIATLTITASDSCSAVYTRTLVIEPAPTANFMAENTCEGNPVQFTDLSQTGGTGAISSWEWNFGDPVTGWNNISILQNPVHTYATAGTYQVSLTVHTANGCVSTSVQSITINPQPAVDFYTDAHCANSPVQFHPASNVNVANVAEWLWDFGDGLTGNTAEPLHTYPVPGNYQVTLTITDLAGCQNSITHNLPVYPQPTVVFGFSQPACSQSSVYFNTSSSAAVGYLVRWEWDFGDGSSQTVNFPANPAVTHQYASYGNYNVTLTVITNDSCSNSLVQTITVLPGPTANFSTTGGCAGMNMEFEDLSQGSVSSWSWNFGDPLSGSSNISSFQNPEHLYSQAGNYVVSLAVGSTNGCSDTVVKNVVVSAAPTVDFSYNNGCANDTIQFTSTTFVNVASTASWFWQFGDNSTSTASDPVHFYTNPGTYTVTLTITSQGGCVNTKSHQVQVTMAPAAHFVISNPACSGTAVDFDDASTSSGGTIESWLWNFGDGNQTTVYAPGNPDVSHTYATSGIYTVSLTIQTTSGCESTETNNLVVSASPVAAFSSEGSCMGSVTSFTDLSQVAGGATMASWAWDFGDPASGINNTAAIPNPFHIYENAGTYTVTLTVINSYGCSNTISQTVTIAAPPAVDFLYSQPACAGSAITFQADPSIVVPATVSAYDWDFGDGSAHSSLASPAHSYASAGDYTVVLTIANLAGCENSMSHAVTIHSLPVANFASAVTCSNNMTEFTDQSYNPDGTDIVSWQWDFGVTVSTGDTSSLQNPVYSYASAGNYQVTLTVVSEGGCSSTQVLPVTIIPAPQADYSFTAEPCHNGSVIFQDMSTSAQSLVTGWRWEFLPGSYSTLRDPVFVFGFTDTTFNVKLVVFNALGCSDTIVKQVYIPKGLEMDINNTQTCFGETTWFTNEVVSPAGDSIAFFNWNFGEPTSGINNISHLPNPSHTYGKPGTFVVTLEATDIHNCTSTVYRMIEVASLPVAQFSYSGGDCDSLVSFSDKTTGAAIETWIWNYGDGSSDTIQSPVSPNVNHYYTFPGIYFTTLTTISTGGCTSTVTDTVRRTPCIVSTFDAVDSLLCQKKEMHFVDMSTCQAPIASWTWDFGDNTVTTFTQPQAVVKHAYTEAGTFTVKLTVATQMVGGAVTATSSQQVAVNPAPKSNFTWKDVCIGAETPFTNTTTGNGSQVKDYSWKFGDPMDPAATSTLRNPSYAYAVAGTYDVNLVSSNTIGCYDTIMKTVTIFAPPQADFDWSNSCEGKPVYFADRTDTTSSHVVTWNWYFSDENSMLGASTKQNPSFDFVHAGIFDTRMIVVDQNGCGDTITRQVAINASPVAVFSISENFDNTQGKIKLNNGTVNGTNFYWDFGNGMTSYADEPEVQYDRDGDYTIQLVTWNGQDCADTTSLDYSFMYKGLYVPNAFAPEDTHSGVTVFKPAGVNLAKYYIEVCDRWGNVLWSSDKIDAKGSPVEGWDGTVNNNYVQEGVYLWRAKAIFRDGSYWDGHNVGNNDNLPQTFTGTVTLIR